MYQSLTTKALSSHVCPWPMTAERTAAETRVPSARRPSNSRTLVLIRTSSRNNVAVPWLPSGRLAAR
jgi:hypothetical protein